MAETIVYGIAERIISTLSSHAIQSHGSAIGINKEIKKLKNTLITIKDVLIHAEELQMNKPEVKEWLRRVKDASYEAEDIIDDFTLEALHKKVEIQGKNVVKSVRTFFSSSSNSIVYHYKIAGRIKKIRKKFEEIVADKSFYLETRVEETIISRNLVREQTHSYVVEGNVFGREGDKEKIVKLLLDFNGVEDVSIIPIKGMGGLGKTTLAQLAVNDERVVSSFKLKLWVCVSMEFDVQRIVQEIIKSATNSECPNMGMDQLQSRVRGELEGKRYLLVLDDVWNEDAEKWEKLKDLLIGGGRGSKIIVTTRSEKVASIMGAVSTYHLSGLSDDDCWNLFKVRAFNGGRDQEHPELVEIGKDMVQKCGGVPLAAKTLGSMMHFKTARKEWELVKNNGLWKFPQNENDILPALRISYNHLPFYLRQCFAYCSIFPKDSELKKEMLIQLWIANGFIHSSVGNQSLEDIGSEYVADLLWRSFFQEPKVDSYRNLLSFKMHDLIHDLAQSVGGMEVFIAANGGEYIPEGVRHLHVIENSPSFRNLGASGKLQTLRTLFCSNCDSFASFKFLRVLVINGEKTEALPNSIGILKHLRYLEIICDKLKTLPKSITDLLCLNTLRLRCDNLEELPVHISKLITLNHINIEACSSLSYIPRGLNELTSLQTFSVFIVSKGGTGCELNELNRLSKLGGKLTIKNLENVRSSRESVNVNLKGKENIEALKLLWNEMGRGHINGEELAFDVLGNLEPHSNIKRLKVKGYMGTGFPSWMMKASFPNVVKVTLWGCNKCQELPPFCQLPYLEVLHLVGLESLQFVETEAVRRRKSWFPSLRSLRLRSLPNLKSWPMPENVEQSFMLFPSLIKVEIYDCPRLRSLPLIPYVENLDLKKCSGRLVHSLLRQVSTENNPNPNYSSSSSLVALKTLEIGFCDDLECLPEDGLKGLTCLKSLTIQSCHKLLSLPELGLQGLTGLLSLKIWKCNSLTTLSEGMRYLTSLQSLNLYMCRELHLLEGLDGLRSLETLKIELLTKLMVLPAGIQLLTALQSLQITNCHGLVALPEGLGNLTALRSLEISSCSKLQFFPEGMYHLTRLESLGIYGCPGLMRWPSRMGDLRSLRDLTISCSFYLPSLPQEMQHLTSIQSLHINDCRDITALPEWMVNLTLLRRFLITDCPKLRILPEGILELTTLQELQISGCEHLRSRYDKKIGKDRSKVAHIEKVVVVSYWN
ncbi:hypothetical protein ACHQM5_012706 [Ranunculus cassubicifolius]